MTIQIISKEINWATIKLLNGVSLKHMKDRYLGCLTGLAAGDALGTTVEFQPPESFLPVTGMSGGGPFDLKPGEWTDDTSMALCLAESLLAGSGFDPLDQMQRYVRWYRDGYWSSTGRCFDIGNTVRSALDRFELSGNVFSGSTDPHSAGNGSLMRLAPVPMFYASDIQKALHFCGESSRTTHGAPAAIDACRYFGALLVGALLGEGKESILEPQYCPLDGYWDKFPLATEIAEIAAGSYKKRQPPQIKGSGYVVRSLEAALWAFYRSSNFEEGCLLAANLGDDADTTCAIFGQIAGAIYGYQSIPGAWLQTLAYREEIQDIAERLFLAVSPGFSA